MLMRRGVFLFALRLDKRNLAAIAEWAHGKVQPDGTTAVRPKDNRRKVLFINA